MLIIMLAKLFHIPYPCPISVVLFARALLASMCSDCARAPTRAEQSQCASAAVHRTTSYVRTYIRMHAVIVDSAVARREGRELRTTASGTEQNDRWHRFDSHRAHSEQSVIGTDRRCRRDVW
jgi:hypothetical protein